VTFAGNVARRSARVATVPWRVLPDFLVIGAMKSGTTTLFAYLKQHPEIRAPANKEIHYFDHDYHRGTPWYRAHFPLFAALPRRRRSWLTGEGSPGYLHSPLAPSRVINVLPKVRLIAVLRHPTERAFSHYNHLRSNGFESLTFREALDVEVARRAAVRQRVAVNDRDAAKARMFAYTSNSLYAAQLDRWLTFFAREQLLVLCAEELYATPTTVLNQVFRFLGLREDVQIQPRHLNARRYEEDMEPDLRARLNNYFAPSVGELERSLGRSFGWNL
jgi:Sulfotransferase domain